MKQYTHHHKKKTGNRKKEIDTFSLSKKCSPSCTPWMIALKGTGNIRKRNSSVPCQPCPWDPVMFPMAHCWQDWSEPGRRGDQAQDEWWRTETWLDVTYLLSNLEGPRSGRTGWVHWSRTRAPPTIEHPEPASPAPPPTLSPSHKCGILNQCRPKNIFSNFNKSSCSWFHHPEELGANLLLCMINPWFYCCKSLCL